MHWLRPPLVWPSPPSSVSSTASASEPATDTEAAYGVTGSPVLPMTRMVGVPDATTGWGVPSTARRPEGAGQDLVGHGRAEPWRDHPQPLGERLVGGGPDGMGAVDADDADVGRVGVQGGVVVLDQRLQPRAVSPVGPGEAPQHLVGGARVVGGQEHGVGQIGRADGAPLAVRDATALELGGDAVVEGGGAPHGARSIRIAAGERVGDGGIQRPGLIGPRLLEVLVRLHDAVEHEGPQLARVALGIPQADERAVRVADVGELALAQGTSQLLEVPHRRRGVEVVEQGPGVRAAIVGHRLGRGVEGALLLGGVRARIQGQERRGATAAGELGAQADAAGIPRDDVEAVVEPVVGAVAVLHHLEARCPRTAGVDHQGADAVPGVGGGAAGHAQVDGGALGPGVVDGDGEGGAVKPVAAPAPHQGGRIGVGGGRPWLAPRRSWRCPPRGRATWGRPPGRARPTSCTPPPRARGRHTAAMRRPHRRGCRGGSAAGGSAWGGSVGGGSAGGGSAWGGSAAGQSGRGRPLADG